MTTFKVKIYLRTGESLSFLTWDLPDLENPFPNLGLNEYLYFPLFDCEDDHANERTLKKLASIYGWYDDALQTIWFDIVNFVVVNANVRDPDFTGLTREAAQELAMNRNMSFRVVLENGIPLSVEDGYNESRINVYLDNNIVYLAEIF